MATSLFHTLRTKTRIPKVILHSSPNKRTSLCSSLKSTPQRSSMGRNQKEIANNDIAIAYAGLNSSKGSFFGLATIIMGSILISDSERYGGQRSSCSTTLLETPPHGFPFFFTKPNAFPENYDVSVRAVKGSRLNMEDEYYIDNGGRFVAIFDGHGGGEVSTFLRETLYDKITKHLIAQKEEKKLESTKGISAIVNSIKAAFTEIGDEVLEMDNFQYQGSTALAVWLHEDLQSNRRTLVSANLGDSRAILSRNGQAIVMTRDHKPGDALEKQRILSMGETIEWDEHCQFHRVRNLSLSRAIGDRFAKPAISSEVEIQLFPLLENSTDSEGKDEFIVLASDGLWDVMTSQDCVNFIHEHLKVVPDATKKMSPLEMQRQKHAKRKVMSRFVANEALKRGSADNVCIVIVWL